jgi:hypothetical protein
MKCLSLIPLADSEDIKKAAPRNAGSPITVVSYGGGTNSSALLIGMVTRGEPPPYAILFADTGGEHPSTYAYLRIFSDWLEGQGYPRITVVWKVTKEGHRLTLEENCLQKRMLPSEAYGYKSCSQKYKIQSQDKWCNNDPVLRGEWTAGRTVTKLIGFDADEPQRARSYDDAKYTYRYPLIEWTWGREECVQAIAVAGLPQPGKSSCFFCPNMKPREVRELQRNDPELFARALAMEANAELTSIKGLGMDWSWRQLANQTLLFPEAHDRERTMPCGCYDGAA